jgi:amino acid adenylation domain-containing protein
MALDMGQASRGPVAETPLAAGQTLHGLLDIAAAARPGAPAVRDAQGGWDYAELRAQSRAFAAWLGTQGVCPGDRVLTFAGNTREFVAMLFGTLGCGAIFVPVNPGMKRFQLASVLADAAPRLAITTGPDLAAVAGAGDVPVRTVRECWPAVTGLKQRAGELPGTPVRHDDLALLIYTSGSTSAPKAVMSPHASAVFAARAIASRLRYRPDDVVLTAIPLSFDYGLYQIFLSVLATAELLLPDTSAHMKLIGTARRHGATVLPVVPSLAEMLVRLARRAPEPVTTVRLFTNTGEALGAPLIASLRRTFPAAQVAPMFGTTECKRITILEPDGDLTRPGSVGRALPGTEVRVLGLDGRELPPGEAGEIVVSGPHVMRGYWRAPELTAQRFRRDPVTGAVTLHTGDYGHLDADGYLYFHGRRDDLFKRRGVRASVTEIEAATLDIDGVSAAAVVPPGQGCDLAVFVVAAVPPEQVLAGLAERLESAKVPATCHVLSELPLTPNGKTDRRRLRAIFGNAEAQVPGAVSLPTPR